MSEFIWKPLDEDNIDIHSDPNSSVDAVLGVKKSLMRPADRVAEIITSGSMFDEAKEIIELIRPYVKKDGGDVNLVGIRDNWVLIKFEGNCNDCGAFSGTLLTIEESICEEIPGARGVEVLQDE